MLPLIAPGFLLEQNIPLAIAIVVGSSVAYAGGSTMQHLAVSRLVDVEAENRAMNLRQLWRLIRTPLWLLGLFTIFIGASNQLGEFESGATAALFAALASPSRAAEPPMPSRSRSAIRIGPGIPPAEHTPNAKPSVAVPRGGRISRSTRAFYIQDKSVTLRAEHHPYPRESS